MRPLAISITHDNVEVAHKSDIIFLAVKPHSVRQVCAEIAPSITKEKLTVSVALGVTIRSIESVCFFNIDLIL
jgi:pyrroline-5-carboxylate reductase